MTLNNPANNISKIIQSLVSELKDKGRKIEELEEQVKLLKGERKELEENTIPETMLEAGVQQMMLLTGDIVSVKPFYYARLLPENNQPFFQWMRDSGFGALIKEKIEIIPTADEIQSVLNFLINNHLYFEQGSTIHWKTLEAWYKEMVEGGANVPSELFNCYTGKKAKITEKK